MISARWLVVLDGTKLVDSKGLDEPTANSPERGGCDQDAMTVDPAFDPDAWGR
jgi:hypothetical protein